MFNHRDVSLDSIVYAFLNGQTAESIAQSFPLLTLEQVYGAIAVYLANRDEIDAEAAERGALLQHFFTAIPASWIASR